MRLPSCLFAALSILTTWPGSGFAKDKGDTYLYSGFVVPQYFLSADSITAENNKESRAGEENTTPESGVSWSAEASLALAVGFSYKGFGFGTSFDIEDKEQEDNTDQRATKVETTYKSYDFSYFFERFGISVAHTDLQGMKILDTTGEAAETLDPEGPDTFRPDIRIRSKSANAWLLPLRYNLNLDTFFDPAKPSQGTGIGLIVGGSYDDLDLRMKRPLISDAYAQPFGADASYMKGKFVTWSAFLGPMVTLDFRGFYCSAMIATGNGKQKLEYQNEHKREKTVEGISEKLNAFLATGYKGQDYFLSVNASFDEPAYRLDSMILSTNKGYMSVTFGRRF